MNKLKKAALVNSLVLLLGALGLAILDANLSLGEFQGLVFYLYFVYFCALQILVNLIVGLVLWLKDRSGWALSYVVSGLLIPGLSIGLAIGIVTVAQML